MFFFLKSGAILGNNQSKINEKSEGNFMSEDKKETKEVTTDEKIEENGSVVTKNGDFTLHCITIIGQIEGHYELTGGGKATKYEHILPLLVAVEESEAVDGLLVLINTVGGDVEAGLAIAELIAGMKKPTVSLVLGGGHSIGVPLAVAAKRSFIAPSASMTIHPVRINGLVIGAPQTYEYLAGMQERIVSFVTAHSRISRRDYTRLMSDTRKLANDVGTILSGEEAVQCGLIDQMGTLSDALEYLKITAGVE